MSFLCCIFLVSSSMFWEVAMILLSEMATHFPGCLLIILSYFLMSGEAFSKAFYLVERYGCDIINLFIYFCWGFWISFLVVLYRLALMYMVSVSLSSVSRASCWVRVLFFVAWIRMPSVPRIVMPRVFAKIRAGSSSRRAVRWFW